MCNGIFSEAFALKDTAGGNVVVDATSPANEAVREDKKLDYEIQQNRVK